jgi:anti-anti-sigma factor
VTVVRLKTCKLVDEDTVPAAFDPLYALVGEVGSTRLVLNLAAVEQLGSLAVAKLLTLLWKVRAGSGRLALCQLPPAAAELFETSPTKVFDIYATEEEAMQSFS